MIKRSYKIVLIVLAIISVLCICFISSMRNVSSIGIIGAADGPTSILIAENLGNRMLLYVGTGFLIITLIMICIFFIKKK